MLPKVEFLLKLPFGQFCQSQKSVENSIFFTNEMLFDAPLNISYCYMVTDT